MTYNPPRRTNPHQYDDYGRGAFIQALSEFATNEINDNDYGIDFSVTLTDEHKDGSGEIVSTDDFYVQLKSSKKEDDDIYDSKKGEIFWDIDISALLFLHRRQIPSFLFIYHLSTDTLYWESIQKRVWDTLDQDSDDWRSQEQKRININAEQTVGGSLDEIRTAVSEVQDRIVLRRTLELSNGSLLGSAYWTAKAAAEINIPNSHTFYDELNSYVIEAMFITNELRNLSDRQSIDENKLLKLLERATIIRERLAMFGFEDSIRI